MISKSIFLLSICSSAPTNASSEPCASHFKTMRKTFFPSAASSRLASVARCGTVNLSARFASKRSSPRVFCRAFRVHDEKFIARVWQPGETEHFYRRRGTSFLDWLAAIVQERFHFATVIAANERIADLQRSHLHDNGGSGTTPCFDLRFNHSAARSGIGRCFQFHHFGLQRHHLEQLIDACAFGCRDGTNDRFASPILRCELAFLQLVLHPVHVGRGKIDFVT